MGYVQLFAGLGAAPFPAQPLPVEQVGTGQLGANASVPQPLDRLLVAALRRRAFTEQRTDPGLDTQRPLRRDRLGAFGQPLQRGLGQGDLTGPGRRLGQLGYDQRPEPQMAALEGGPGGVPCGGMLSEAVVRTRALARVRYGRD
jgi:hypothetical protein